MPMFQTFADYDKWRRRQLFLRLEKLQNLPLRPDSIVKVAEKAGDPSIKYGQLSRGLQAGIDRQAFPDDGISAALRAAIDTRLNEGDALSPDLLRQSQGVTPDTLDPNAGKPGKPPAGSKGKDKEKKENKGKGGGGQGPDHRGGGEGAYGGDLVLVGHDGLFYSHSNAQLTGLGATIPPDDALDGYTLSFWIRMNGQKTASTRITHGTPANRINALYWNANGSLTFYGTNERGTTYALDTTAVNILTDGQLHHVMVSAIRAAPDKVQIWVDGSLVSDQVFAGNYDPLGEEEDWYLCADHNGSQIMDDGDQLGAMWQNQEFVADPVGVFIEAAGDNPVALTGGTDGSGFTGEVPLIYFNELADWNSGTNRGDGGAFVVIAGEMDAVEDP